MITFITPTQGNPVALKRTMESLRGICDEFIVGAVCIFPEDEFAIDQFKKEFNLRVINLPFNFIYQNGFSVTLNLLASFATNSVVIYLNVGEIIEKYDGSILSKISNEYNCYYIDHSKEKHRWFRAFCPKEMKWSGLIHEEISGEHRPYYKPLFTFADTEKDMTDAFKAAVYNDTKEITYWRQLMRISDDPDLLDATSPGWLEFARDNYQTMKDRLSKKGNRPMAFENGDYLMYMNDILTNPEFEKDRFESNHIIEFQGSPMYLGKINK